MGGIAVKQEPINKTQAFGASKAMPPRQQRFVEEYLVDSNATQAAIRAGYSRKTAYSQGHRLLKNAEVADAVREGRTRIAEKAELNSAWVVAEAKKNHEDAIRRGRIADSNRALDLIGQLIGAFYYGRSNRRFNVTYIVEAGGSASGGQ